MAKIKEVHYLIGRTVSPASNKYEPFRFEHGMTVVLEEGDDPAAVREQIRGQCIANLMRDVNSVKGA